MVLSPLAAILIFNPLLLVVPKQTPPYALLRDVEVAGLWHLSSRLWTSKVFNDESLSNGHLFDLLGNVGKADCFF